MDWYYRKSDSSGADGVKGPLRAVDIIALVRDGRLGPDYEVRVGEHGQWRRVTDMPALLPARRVSAPARLRRAAAIPLKTAAPVFSAHWEGRQSLAMSFWGYFLLPLLGIQALLFAGLKGWWPAQSAALAAIAAVSLVVLPWQFIGTWRASERHRQDHRDAMPALAEAGMIIGALGIFLHVAWSLPQILPSVMLPVPAPIAVETPPARELVAPAESEPDLPLPRATAQIDTTGASTEAPTNLSGIDSGSPAAAWRNQIEADEGLSLLRQAAPEAWRYVARSLEASLLGKPANIDAIWRRLDVTLTQLAQQSIARANEAVTLRYVRAVVDQLQALEKTDAQACVSMAYPEPDADPASQVLPIAAGLKLRERAAMIELIVDAYSRESIDTPFQAVEGTLREVYSKLARRHGPGIYKIYEPAAHGYDVATRCRITVEIYEQFLMLPPPARIKVLRYIFAPPD